MNKSSKTAVSIKVIADNKKARFNYHLEEKFEVGIVLLGCEVKSIKNNQINLAESYVRVDSGEMFLVGAHIPEYSHSSAHDYKPTRPRKLLMQKRQIMKLQGKVQQKGLTLVPVKIYLKHGLIKLEIALAKGKDSPDKRKTVQERDLKRRAERAMKNVR